MPNDPGLSADTCIFMEAVSGDGGVHNGNGPSHGRDMLLRRPHGGQGSDPWFENFADLNQIG